MELKSKSVLTIWTVEEIVEDMENQQLDKGLYEQEEIDNYLKNVVDKVEKALNVIEKIKGIEAIDVCKEILGEISDKLSY